MNEQCDILVVGGGPGGYVAAIRGAQLGASVTLVERDALGGVCLNWGCIPTKALLRAADIRRLAMHGDEFGLRIGRVDTDCKKLVARSRAVADQLSRGIGYLMKKNAITVVKESVTGLAPAQGGWEVGTDDARTIAAKRVILAMGASARELPDLGLVRDGQRIWTAREAMTPRELPKSVIVVGSGAIGIEFASMYTDLGVQVSVVEAMDGILPNEDTDISAMARAAFEARAVTFHTSARITGVKATKSSVRLSVDQGADLTAEALILAVGIVGNADGMGLLDLGVVVEGGHVRVDHMGATGVDNLYAIGDLTGPPWLAHKASHQAAACVEGFLADGRGFDARNIPACTYCHPQIASVGLTEAAARATGVDVSIGRFPLSANGKALALGEGEGLVKTVFETGTGQILGAHIIGAEATELIGVFALARQAELTEQDIMHTIFPHPTVSEALHESALDAFGRALHM